MSKQFITVEEHDQGSGIDSRSASGEIRKGFVQDALNADVTEGRIGKRKGYQGYAGGVPVRVREVTYGTGATDNITFRLDGSIDLSSVPQSPIIIYGRTSGDNISNLGRFPNDSDTAKYYSTFSSNARVTLSEPSGTATVVADDHVLPSAHMFVGVTESTSAFSLANSQLISDGISIDQSSLDISVTYSVPEDISAFIFYADRSALDGSVYVTGNTAVAAGATESIAVVAGTHALDTFSIQVKAYIDTGSVNEEVIPDSVEISPTGTVTASVTNSSGSSIDVFLILSAVPAGQVLTGSVANGATETISIMAPESPWAFVSCYLEQSLGGTLEQVLPESVIYDPATDQIDVTFINETGATTNFEIFYSFGAVVSNKFTVTDSSTIGVAFTDETPQLTVWGLSHDEIYGTDRAAREGWVTGLDSYRRSEEQRLVTALGGNLFSAQELSEAGTTYLYPTRYPFLVSRISGDQVIGPTFYSSVPASARTRGYLTGTSVTSDNRASVTSVSWNSGTGYTDYVLSFPGKSIEDSAGDATSLSAVISTTAGKEDYLTVTQMGRSELNGSFRIAAITDGSDEITISVDNSSVTDSDLDATNAGGFAAIYSDQLTLTGTSKFIGSDILTSESFPTDSTITVLSSSSALCVLSGVTETTVMPNGQRVTAARTSRVIPLRDSTGAATVENVVRGDILTYAPIDRLLRVRSVNVQDDITLAITGNGTTATATLATGSTEDLATGDYITIYQAGTYTGTHQITVTGTTTFTFSSSGTASAQAGTLLGYTIEVDEELSFQDSHTIDVAMTVPRRWIPVEAPGDSYDLTPATYRYHLDSAAYGSQSFLRSVMVADNLYLTNGSDEVHKFDGTNISRAGLPRWQPGYLTSIDTGASGKISVQNPTATVIASGRSQNRFLVTLGHENRYTVGDRVRDSADSSDYVIESLSDDGTNGIIEVDKSLSSSSASSGTLTQVSRARYYFRISAIDANNNLIASAVTGADDYTVDLASDAAVTHRLTGLPALANYDYDRLELEIYRTKFRTNAPFYRLGVKSIPFNSDDGYIDFTDAFSDDDLTDLDPVNSALLGTEIGTTWSEPLRGKYITSAGNSLVLANVKDYPQIDLEFFGTGLALSDFTGDIYTFRKDNSASGSTTDMINTVRYEFVATALAVSGIEGTEGASFTVTTSTTHGLSVNDWTYLTWSSTALTGRDLTYAGLWQVSAVPTTSTFTVNFSGSLAGTAANFPTSCAIATDPTDVPVYTGTDGAQNTTSGNSSFVKFRIGRRLAEAINASMRRVDTTITGFSDFSPWLTASAGNEFRSGQVQVRVPLVLSTTPELLLPAYSGYDVFVQGLRRAASTQISASTYIYPSRLLVSYENFPELFDAPTALLDSDSSSAIDVDPSNGQEITGVVPFFGESAFGSAQKSGILVVFKERSIYLVDISQKRAGGSPVQKIQSLGLGCTAPYSIANTKEGIAFANSSGIYVLRPDLQIEYIGRNMENFWKTSVDRDQLEICQGHHYSDGRKYKVSVPVGTSTLGECSDVYVYDHTLKGEELGEDARSGSWTRYDNHPATGWCNLGHDAFFSSTTGRVFSVRRVGDSTDYRDDNAAIPFSVTLRQMHFGDSGVRKLIGSVISHWQSPDSATSGTSLSFAWDRSTSFESTDSFVVSSSDLDIRHTLSRRRGSYLQLKISNSTLDESAELAGLDIRVSGLSDRGLRSAEDTRS